MPQPRFGVHKEGDVRAHPIGPQPIHPSTSSPHQPCHQAQRARPKGNLLQAVKQGRLSPEPSPAAQLSKQPGVMSSFNTPSSRELLTTWFYHSTMLCTLQSHWPLGCETPSRRKPPSGRCTPPPETLAPPGGLPTPPATTGHPPFPKCLSSILQVPALSTDLTHTLEDSDSPEGRSA